jgi:7-carboxy-7-deazaguanine synthase
MRGCGGCFFLMQVTEIFFSIQGESTFTGRPCIFVRLTACNLRCVWCDSEYTFTGGVKMSQEEVLARVDAYPCKLVEITGGEPMLQEKEVLPLCRALLDRGCQVLIETSGERDLSQLPAEVIKIMDVKCPGSGEGGSFRMSNLDTLTPRDEVKFVLADRRDYDFTLDFIRTHSLREKVNAVNLSPVFGSLNPRDLAEWMLADGLDARLGMQIHKFIWDPMARGV